jgi:pectin methylesterase-like acyl-CoA thioesterase
LLQSAKPVKNSFTPKHLPASAAETITNNSITQYLCDADKSTDIDIVVGSSVVVVDKIGLQFAALLGL